MAVRRRPTPGVPGQHFLRSSRLAAELVHDAGIAPGEFVVDIGAGSGVLTRALLEAGARVTALELDPALAAQLRRRFTGSEVTVLEAMPAAGAGRKSRSRSSRTSHSPDRARFWPAS